MNETCFSGSALILFGGLLAAVTGALGVMFRLLIEGKDQHIAYLEARNERLFQLALSGTEASERSLSTAEQAINLADKRRPR